MAKFNCLPNVGENVYKTYKAASTITDADLNKPVKIGADSEVALCADGDQIYGFIAAVAPATADGKKIVSVLTSGRAWVTLDGASAVGTLVEAAANAAAGTANTGTKFAKVSTHTLVAATHKQWMVIAGTGEDTATVVVESL